MRLIAMICAAAMVATPTLAQDRETLGRGSIFTNDFLGDNEDRWRSGSYAYSIMRGPSGTNARPAAPGVLLEYRLRSEIIAPSALNGAGEADRAYAGTLSAGIHTHFARGGADISAGIDVVATGPQTGVLDLQDSFHDLVGAPTPSTFVEDNQIENGFYPTALAELSYRIPVGAASTLRPFVEAQYGIEDFVRVGADLLIGETLQSDLWLRDSASGQLYSGIQSGQPGTGFVLGADYAAIGDSDYFPASFGTVALKERWRARAGVHWRLSDAGSYFYGVTYLSEEYAGQDGGQVVGSLNLNFNF